MEGQNMRHKIGTVDGCGVFVRVEYPAECGSKPGKPELSIRADVCRSGHFVAGGQSLDTVRRVATHGTPAKDWPVKRILRLLDVWERWHLNGMRAGCKHQRAWGWNTLPVYPDQPTSAYVSHPSGGSTWNMLAWLTRSEHPNGLLSHPCPICGYKYGSAWLYEPLSVLARQFVESLICPTT